MAGCGLYCRAAGGVIRVPGGDRADHEDARTMSTRNAGWGAIAGETCDHDDRVAVRLEAPGIESDGFHLQVVDDNLVERGEKHISRDRRWRPVTGHRPVQSGVAAVHGASAQHVHRQAIGRQGPDPQPFG